MGRRRTGFLERVEPRAVWEHERADFTPWLAEPGNLALLGDAVGLRLEGPRLETPIDGFRADMLCRDADTCSPVVIEAQLGPGDHRHLGQIVAYSAGFRPSATIWLAERFHDVHRAAIDRLNAIDDARWFAVEFAMWRIEGSVAAPIFTVVSGPGEEKTKKTERPPCRVRPLRGAFQRAARA